LIARLGFASGIRWQRQSIPPCLRVFMKYGFYLQRGANSGENCFAQSLIPTVCSGSFDVFRLFPAFCELLVIMKAAFWFNIIVWPSGGATAPIDSTAAGTPHLQDSLVLSVTSQKSLKSVEF
jgi:hypothetical protein